MAKLSWRTALVVLFGGVLAPLLSAENRMMMMLHLWLPCVRFLPSTEDKLVVLLEKYFYLEKAWSPSSFEPDDIPEIHAEDYSLPKLLELSVNGRKPVIVRGLMNHSKAFSEAGKAEWVQKYQDFNVLQLFMNPGKHYTNESTMKAVTFREYVEDIQQGKAGYALGFDEMLTRYPEIYPSLGLEQLQVGCRSLSLMVNGDGEGLKFHNENHPNFVSTYHGKKTWDIISYKFSVFLGPKLPPGSMSFGYLTTPHRIVDRMQDLLPKTTVILEPGDSLYNPPWAWHRVKNTADAQTKLVVMSACRWSDVPTAVRLSPALELYKSLGWQAFVHPKLPLWLRWLPFFHVVQDGFREAFGPRIPSFGEAGYDQDCFSSKAKGCENVLKRTGHGVI